MASESSICSKTFSVCLSTLVQKPITLLVFYVHAGDEMQVRADLV